MLPAAVAAVPVVTKSLETVTKVVQDLGGALGLAPTALDQARKATAADLLKRALAGDDGAVIALGYSAFEKRTGAPGDPRTPADGNYSPQAVRDLSVSALKKYVAARGGLPSAASQWAAKLSTTVVAPRMSLGDAVFGAVEEGVTRAAADAARERATTVVGKATPWVIGGAVVLIGVLVYFAVRKK